MVLDREIRQNPDGFLDPGGQLISASDFKWNEQNSGRNPEVLALEFHSSEFKTQGPRSWPSLVSREILLSR